MKEESLVIVNQQVTVKLFLSLVHTARHALGIFLIGSNESKFCTFALIFVEITNIGEVIGAKS